MFRDIQSILEGTAEEINKVLNKEFKKSYAPMIVKSIGGTQDQIAMNEEFNNRTDSLCKEGIIPDFVYNEACLGDYDDSEWRDILQEALNI